MDTRAAFNQRVREWSARIGGVVDNQYSTIEPKPTHP